MYTAKYLIIYLTELLHNSILFSKNDVHLSTFRILLNRVNALLQFRFRQRVNL